MARLTKLLSCLGFAERNAKKLGRDSAIRFIKMARVALLQMDDQPPRKSRQMIHLDLCLPVAHASPGRHAECQTCEEVLTRTQFEAFMKSTSDNFMSTLENMQTLVEQSVATILDLRRQLDEQDAGEKLDTASSYRPCAASAAGMRLQQEAACPHMLPLASSEDKAPPSSHLQLLRGRHVKMKKA